MFDHLLVFVNFVGCLFCFVLVFSLFRVDADDQVAALAGVDVHTSTCFLFHLAVFHTLCFPVYIYLIR